MSLIIKQFFILLIFVLFAWGVGKLSSVLRLGRMFGYFVTGVVLIYIVENYISSDFRFWFCLEGSFFHYLSIFVYTYLGVYFFQTTQGLNLGILKKPNFNLLCVVGVYAVVGLLFIFTCIKLFSSYFASFYHNDVLKIISLFIFSPILLKDKLFLQSKSHVIYSQFFLFLAVLIFCFGGGIGGLVSFKKGILSAVVLSIIFALISRINFNNPKTMEEKISGYLVEKSLPSKLIFYLLFFTLFIFVCVHSFFGGSFSTVAFTFLLLGFASANLLQEKVYGSLNLIHHFHIGKIVLGFYLAFLFQVGGIDFYFLFFLLVFKLLVGSLIGLVSSFFINVKKGFEFFYIFLVFPTFSLFTFSLFSIGAISTGLGSVDLTQGQISSLILVEIIGGVLFSLFYKEVMNVKSSDNQEEKKPMSLEELFGEELSIIWKSTIKKMRLRCF